MRVLILGGTAEGRRLAGMLPGVDVISSLAGRTREPLLPAGDIRIGGFGGADGLAAYLRAERITVLIDATHPFAAKISLNAYKAAEVTGVPLLVLRRPPYTEQTGDHWRRAPDLAGAAALLPGLGERVFLSTGRQGLAHFAAVDGCWFLARSVEPPEPPLPRRLAVLLDRGPFMLDDERRLLAEHRIDVVVSKDSGGPAPKLDAARERGIPVILIERPPPVPATATVTTPDEAAAWIREHATNG